MAEKQINGIDLKTYSVMPWPVCLLMSKADLDRGIAFAKAHHDRVIPYAAIILDIPTVLEDVQKVYDMGFKGKDWESHGLMAHLRPAGLADIIAMHPKLIVHAAHFGNPWYEEAAEGARAAKNNLHEKSQGGQIE